MGSRVLPNARRYLCDAGHGGAAFENGMQVFEDIRAEDQGGANVPGVKAALQLIGEDCGGARPPAAWPLTEVQMTRLKGFMIKNGLIQ